MKIVIVEIKSPKDRRHIIVRNYHFSRVHIHLTNKESFTIKEKLFLLYSALIINNDMKRKKIEFSLGFSSRREFSDYQDYILSFGSVNYTMKGETYI